jgi:hypothetical protein
MMDSELRGIVLKRFYDRRIENSDSLIVLTEADFQGRFSFQELQRTCQQLDEKQLIDKWRPNMRGVGPQVGVGRITAYGIDVVEGTAKPPLSVTLDQSSHISVTSSQNVQIGNHNVQQFKGYIEQIIHAIDNYPSDEKQKAEAKSLLKKFLEHPLVTAIAGSLASTFL